MAQLVHAVVPPTHSSWDTFAPPCNTQACPADHVVHSSFTNFIPFEPQFERNRGPGPVPMHRRHTITFTDTFRQFCKDTSKARQRVACHAQRVYMYCKAFSVAAPHIYLYIYIYMCVCVCAGHMCASLTLLLRSLQLQFICMWRIL